MARKNHAEDTLSQKAEKPAGVEARIERKDRLLCGGADKFKHCCVQ
jgi:uncharacterized protein YchJ